MTLASAPVPAPGAASAPFRWALARMLAEPSADARAAQRIAGRLLAADLGSAAQGGGGLPGLAPETAALLQALLAHRLCTDLDLERELIALRGRLLVRMLAGAAPELPGDAEGGAPGRDGVGAEDGGLRAGDLAEALARHAFACEYLWPETAEETARLDRLQADLEQDLAAGRDIDDRLFLLAAYRDIARIPALRARIAGEGEARLAPRGGTLRLLVVDRIEEARIADALPALTEVTDAVSARVRDQYEANPYPRWRLCPEPALEPPAAHVARSVAPNEPDLSAIPAEPRILVAGCGTGRQALLWARRCPGADILAVDLSRASLAYARRALRARGIGTVSFAQADLLDLDARAGQFDIVAAVGVLHHLHDPEAGLAALRDRLSPAGAMHLGLYSRRARRAARLSRLQRSACACACRVCGSAARGSAAGGPRRLVGLRGGASRHLRGHVSDVVPGCMKTRCPRIRTRLPRRRARAIVAPRR